MFIPFPLARRNAAARRSRVLFIGVLIAAVALSLLPAHIALAAEISQLDIPGPAGSGRFGTSVTVLPNGNFVVTDPFYDDGATADVGAVTLYDGATLQPISMLKGSSGEDFVGGEDPSRSRRFGGVTVLANGNFAVASPNWKGATFRLGAVTWGSAVTGFGAPVVTVSAENSLVGAHPIDAVGSQGVTALANGNYVVISPDWRNGTAYSAGAATWADGSGGTVGAVTGGNSLVGAQEGDAAGSGGVAALPNGHYVVLSPRWDNGRVEDAGAVTWGNGGGGTVGLVTAHNSFVGSRAGDRVGARHEDEVGSAIRVLANGHYVVNSPFWDNGGTEDVGAVTWGDGNGGPVGPVSPANSLVGSQAGDGIGRMVTPLTNGNYVVASRYWDRGSVQDAGAVTWGNGSGGTHGQVTAQNSLVGTHAGDEVGYTIVGTLEEGCPRALANGNYVVCSPSWDNGDVTDAGAVTWGDGDGGTAGPVSPDNSLVGTAAGDNVGEDATALANGHYVVISSNWRGANGAPARGAVTWGDGTTASQGAVSPANSITVEAAPPQASMLTVTALTNGNYVVAAPYWGGGRGAAFWTGGGGRTGGPIQAASSLVGSGQDDGVGACGVTALTDGNYVVCSDSWDNGAQRDVGGLTWGNGSAGTTGVVGVDNSLVGSYPSDWLGRNGSITPLPGGDYVAFSPHWGDWSSKHDAGAVTWGSAGSHGPLTATNSVFGTYVGGGGSLVYAFDATRSVLYVGRPLDNVVTVARPGVTRMLLTLVFRLEE